MIIENKKFPVPEGESEKLQEVAHTLEQQAFTARLDDQIRSRPWPFILSALALGLLCGLMAAKR